MGVMCVHKKSGFLVLLLVASSLVMAEGAPEAVNPAAGSEAVPAADAATPTQQRIRAWRESYQRRQPPGMWPMSEAAEQRQKEMQAQYEARQQAIRKQREQRAALREKWREARQKYREAQMETWLEMAEEREAKDARRYEEMRNRAEEQHNFLVENHEKMLEQVLQRQIEVANRNEERRRQAEDRRRKLTALRIQMKDMTGDERWNFLQQHRDELSGEPLAAVARPVVPPVVPAPADPAMTPPPVEVLPVVPVEPTAPAELVVPVAPTAPVELVVPVEPAAP